MLNFLKDFILLFIVFFLIYYIFVNKKKKDYASLKEKDEIKVFINKYKLNLKKVSYKTIVLVVSFINAFIVSFTSSIILNIESFLWAILVGFVDIMVLIYSLYTIAGKTLKKMEAKK